VIPRNRSRSNVVFASLVGLVIAGVLGGCGPGSGGSAGGSPVATSTVDLPPSYSFAPAAIAIPTGTTVTWTNNDHFTHSVQFLDGGLPGTPLTMDPGAAVTYLFDRPGLYHYQCHLHPQNMQGTVKVGP
jgi:plastocyanin